MSADAGIELVYLPPYSPDVNPIEESFVKLKGFIEAIEATTQRIQPRDSTPSLE